MVAKTNVQTVFNIPSSWDASQRDYAAQLIIEKIQANTTKGLDKNGNAFPKYSSEYKHSIDFHNADKSNRVDLQLTGDMLNSIEVIQSIPGKLVIGYPTGSKMAGQVEGNQIGSYGNKPNENHARPFLGLPKEQLDLIIAKVNSLTPEQQTSNDFMNNLLNNLLGRVNSGN